MHTGPVSPASIIATIADDACQRVSRKVIRRLQNITDGMQSGPDSPLKNLWDEVCVQVRGSESPLWPVYVETMQDVIEAELESAKPYELGAIWLQTDPGFDWKWDG